MFDNRNIFNIPYSLPCNHSTSLATRRVTRGNEQQALKYMPDYGGILEIPGSNVKQSGLRIGLPFSPMPENIKINTLNQEYESESNLHEISSQILSSECLETTHFYESQGKDSFTTIRALGRNLYFDTVERVILDERSGSHSVQELNSKNYAHVPYTYNICGIKQQKTSCDMLIVKFKQGVKLLKLNPSFKPPSLAVDDVVENDVRFPEQSAFNFLASFPTYQTMTVNDACINTSCSVLGIAFSNTNSVDVKLYDLIRSQRYYKKIQERLQDDRRLIRSLSISVPGDRKSSLRSFMPSNPCFETVKQLENDPFHMVNMILTTSNRVTLIDPRSSKIEHTYTDRYKICPLFPTERFCRMQSSARNSNQFYLLSNVKLRAFDKRFLSQPMNSLEHMLDIVDIDSMNMKVIDSEIVSNLHETICMSANGQLGFVSFDQSQMTSGENVGRLVNPRSIHAPLVEPSPACVTKTKKNELYGLSVLRGDIFEEEEVRFSTAQLTGDGDVWIRGYRRREEFDINYEPSSSRIINDPKLREYSTHKDPASITRRSKAKLATPDEDEEYDFIDVLSEISTTEVQDKLASKRAAGKYEQMKSKLQRIV